MGIIFEIKTEEIITEQNIIRLIAWKKYVSWWETEWTGKERKVRIGLSWGYNTAYYTQKSHRNSDKVLCSFLCIRDIFFQIYFLFLLFEKDILSWLELHSFWRLQFVELVHVAVIWYGVLPAKIQNGESHEMLGGGGLIWSNIF